MDLLTIQDTAEMLKVSTVTVRRFIGDGRVPAVKVGKGVRVRKEVVDQLTEPVEPKTGQAKPARPAGRPITFDDPLFKLIGSATDAEPTDSSKKYEYLADAIAPKAPESAPSGPTAKARLHGLLRLSGPREPAGRLPPAGHGCSQPHRA